MAALSQKILYLYPGSQPLTDWRVQNDGNGEVITFWNTPVLGPQPPQSTFDAITDAQVFDAATNRYAVDAKAKATASVDNGTLLRGNDFERFCRAVADTALDATNTERTCMTQMNNAVQAATSLADLKTRFAAISFPPNVTGAQLVNAIKSKIAATPE